MTVPSVISGPSRMTYTAHSDSGFTTLGRPCRTGSPAGPKWGVGQRIFFRMTGGSAIYWRRSWSIKVPDQSECGNLQILPRCPWTQHQDLLKCRSALAGRLRDHPGLSRREHGTGQCRRGAALGAIGGNAGLGALVGGLTGAAAGGLASRNRAYAAPSPFCF